MYSPPNLGPWVRVKIYGISKGYLLLKTITGCLSLMGKGVYVDCAVNKLFSLQPFTILETLKDVRVWWQESRRQTVLDIIF